MPQSGQRTLWRGLISSALVSTRPAYNACLFISSIFFRLFLTVVLVCSCTCCYIFVSYITNCLCGPHDVNNIIRIHRQQLQLPNGASVTRTTVICRFWLLSNYVVSLNACTCVSTPRREPKMFVAVLEGCVFSFPLKMFSVESSLQIHGAGDRKIHTAGPQNAKLHYKRSSLFASRSSTYVTRPLVFRPSKKVKVAHTPLPSWSRFLAVSLQVTWVINPAVGCHYFPPGLQLHPQPLRGLLPVLLLGEQAGCEQFA